MSQAQSNRSRFKQALSCQQRELIQCSMYANQECKPTAARCCFHCLLACKQDDKQTKNSRLDDMLTDNAQSCPSSTWRDYYIELDSERLLSSWPQSCPWRSSHWFVLTVRCRRIVSWRRISPVDPADYAHLTCPRHRLVPSRSILAACRSNPRSQPACIQRFLLCWVYALRSNPPSSLVGWAGRFVWCDQSWPRVGWWSRVKMVIVVRRRTRMAVAEESTKRTKKTNLESLKPTIDCSSRHKKVRRKEQVWCY